MWACRRSRAFDASRKPRASPSWMRASLRTPGGKGISNRKKESFHSPVSRSDLRKRSSRQSSDLWHVPSCCALLKLVCNFQFRHCPRRVRVFMLSQCWQSGKIMLQYLSTHREQTSTPNWQPHHQESRLLRRRGRGKWALLRPTRDVNASARFHLSRARGCAIFPS